MTQTQNDPQSRLLAKLVRELLATEKFATFACLTDALKWRCARLKIRPTDDAINGAYALIGSNRSLVTATSVSARVRHVERPDDVRPISKAEATAILRRLGVTL